MPNVPTEEQQDKEHKLMHSSGCIETFTNLREAQKECRELNRRFGEEYWVVPKVKTKKKV